MASFIINSVATVAIKKDTIRSLVINKKKRVVEDEEITIYVLSIQLADIPRYERLAFEESDTLEGIQAKAATILAALEE